MRPWCGQSLRHRGAGISKADIGSVVKPIGALELRFWNPNLILLNMSNTHHRGQVQANRTK
jgi:hypothetical protein